MGKAKRPAYAPASPGDADRQSRGGTRSLGTTLQVSVATEQRVAQVGSHALPSLRALSSPPQESVRPALRRGFALLLLNNSGRDRECPHPPSDDGKHGGD